MKYKVELMHMQVISPNSPFKADSKLKEELSQINQIYIYKRPMDSYVCPDKSRGNRIIIIIIIIIYLPLSKALYIGSI